MPELVNIDDWSATSGITDPVEQRKQYVNYVREEYLKEDDSAPTQGLIYNSKIEEYIQNSLLGGLQADGLSGDEIVQALQPTLPTFEEKKTVVERAGVFDLVSRERQPLLAYNAYLQLADSGEATEEYLSTGPQLKEEAEKLIDRKYNQAVFNKG